MRGLADLVGEAAADVSGWGFAWLGVRATEEWPGWGYAGQIRRDGAFVGHSTRLLVRVHRPA